MSSPARPLALLGFVVSAAVLGGCGEEARSPDVDSATEEIVFTVNRDGWGEIWLMDETGHGRRRLTGPAPPRSDASGNTNPRWSPSRDRIAYSGSGNALREDPNSSELYVMDATGGDVRRLTSNRVADWSPDWSPDGKRIVFVRAERGLYLIESDGSGERLLRTEEARNAPVFLQSPTWSPDGQRIAFARVTYVREVPESDLYVMSSDGGRATKIADDAGEPTWSPDGSRIAFASYRDRFGETCFHDCSPSGEIYVVHADGAELKRLTESKADDSSPTWSPDGNSIAFVSDRSNPNAHENEIYVIDADGGQLKRITDNSVWDLEPDWTG